MFGFGAKLAVKAVKKFVLKDGTNKPQKTTAISLAGVAAIVYHLISNNSGLTDERFYVICGLTAVMMFFPEGVLGRKKRG